MRSKRQLLLAVLLVLLSRLLLVAFSVWLPGDDGNRYMLEGANLYNHHSFSDRVDAAPTAHDMPLYPFVLAVFMGLFNGTASAAVAAALANCFVYACAALLLYSIVTRCGGSHRGGLFAIAVFAASPESLPYSVFHMPESLFICLLLLAFHILIRGIESGRESTVLISFVVLAISCYAKPVGLFCGVVFAAMLLVSGRQKRLSYGPSVRLCVLGLLIQALVLSPWVMRNYAQFGSAEPAMVIRSMLFANRNALRQAQETPSVPQVAVTAGAPLPSSPKAPRLATTLLAKEFFLNVQRRPIVFLKAITMKQLGLYAGTGSVALMRLLGFDVAQSAVESGGLTALTSHPGLPALQVVSWLVLMGVYAAAFLGGVQLWKDRAWFTMTLTLLSITYFAAAVCLVPHTRYRMPMLPFFAILSAHVLPRETTD